MAERQSHATIVAKRQPTVRVQLPAKIANDYEKFVEVQRSIFDRLGHLACLSGFDIRWDIVSQYQVDEKLNIQGIAG